MAVLRSNNWLGQQRVDVPHLRAVESSLCADFDVLAGNIIAGLQPVVVSGFDTITTGAVGQPATNLQINVANAIVMHTKATDSGTFLQASGTRPAETLNSTNTRVKGGFTSSSTNYIGIDLVRSADSNTADLVQFLNPVTNIESPKDVPLGRTFDYVIYVSTQDFSATPNVCPLAIVTTDASNNVTAITDARNMLYRLGSGGSNPNPLFTYAWPGGRTELGTNADFSAADKKINSQKDWMNSIMTRLWEVGGGEHWYSNTGWHNVQLVRNGTSVFVSTGDYFEWTGTNLHWQSLRVVFSNSTGWFNDIANQLTDSTGLTDLADGQCIYVDLDRTTNRTGGTALTVLKGTTATLGTPLIPGSRMIIAWRIGTNIFTRGNSYYIGATFNVATTSVVGTVKLHAAATTPATPIVISDGDLDAANGVCSLNANRAIVKTVVAASNATAITGTGDGTGAGGNFIGGSSGVGVFATGNNTREGVNATGGGTGTGGAGVIAVGGGTAGIGVQGTGSGTGAGIKGVGGGGAGAPGGSFTGGAAGGAGVTGTGIGANPGVSGTGGASGVGVLGTGGSNGTGVQAAGTGTGVGLIAQGGATGASAIVAKESAAAATSQVIMTDTAGNAHMVYDHLGFPMGRLGMFDEEFLIAPGAVTIAEPLTVLGSRWGCTSSTGGTLTANGPSPTYAGNMIQLNAPTVSGGNSLHTIAPLFDFGMSNLMVVAEWEATSNGFANSTGMIVMGFVQQAVNNTGSLFNTNFYACFATTQNIFTTFDATTRTSATAPTTTQNVISVTSLARFRIEIYGAASKLGAFTVKYYVNEGLVATHTPAAPTTGNNMYFVVWTPATANSSTLDVLIGGLKIRYHRQATSLPTGI